MFDSVGIGGWVGRPDSSGLTWIEADLRTVAFVHKIASQGRGDGSHNQWVASYKLAYKAEGDTFLFIQDSATQSDMIFQANTDQDTIVYNSFEAVLCRFVRLYPQAYNNAVTLRWEVYGCVYGLSTCPDPNVPHTTYTVAGDIVVFDEVILYADEGFKRGIFRQHKVQCFASGRWTKELESVNFSRKFS